jgi:hypothetical protein
MSYHNLEDLEVYQLAESFSDEVWFIVNGWDYFAKDTGRFHYKENRNFCYFSRGSIIETKGWLKKSKTEIYYPKNNSMSCLKNFRLFILN